jgi:DNA-binding NarL/FixJ family response regulator
VAVGSRVGVVLEPIEDGSAALSVLLVDDHELVRSGVRMLLESCLGHSVVEASSAIEALDVVRNNDVDIVLLDVRMPEHDGLWALEQIRAEFPQLPVVMLSTFDDEDCIRQALERGAVGYLLKEAGVGQVAECLETALAGRGVYLHPVAAERLFGRGRVEFGEHLTEREIDVLKRLVQGATNDEIATRLFVTEKTVKTHVTAIFRKLGVSNRTQAATTAVRDRLVSL